MGKKTLDLNDRLYDYLLNVSLRETPALKALREETDRHEMARMQISADQGQFMALLLKLISAKHVIEIGTFTGYSTLVMAQALPDNGKIIACDISSEWTSIGQRYWQQANMADKIDLRLAPALETLDQLISEGQYDCFDFAFIDADKTNLENYFERSLKLIRPGGLIAIDNVLWGGSVIDPNNQTEDTVAIRHINQQVLTDARVDISLVPIGDGLTLARKR